MKKIIVSLSMLLTLIAMIATPLVNVFAASGETTRTDYIELSNGGSVTKGSFDQEFNKHSIQYGPVSMTTSAYGDHVKVRAIAYKRNWLGIYNNASSIDTDIYQLYEYYYANLGNIGSGAYKYKFTTNINNQNTGAITSVIYIHNNN